MTAELCQCGRGPIRGSVDVRTVGVPEGRYSSILINAPGKAHHAFAADYRCADCIADLVDNMAEVSADYDVGENL